MVYGRIHLQTTWYTPQQSNCLLLFCLLPFAHLQLRIAYCLLRYLPSHSLKSVILSPLTRTSIFDLGTRSSLSFPFICV